MLSDGFVSIREVLPSCTILHKEIFFWNLIELNRNQIIFTIFQLIWNETEIRLVPKQSESGKYNLILGWLNKISKIYLCVCYPCKGNNNNCKGWPLSVWCSKLVLGVDWLFDIKRRKWKLLLNYGLSITQIKLLLRVTEVNELPIDSRQVRVSYVPFFPNGTFFFISNVKH